MSQKAYWCWVSFVNPTYKSYGIARNHPFIDGNKRTAFQVMYAFLKVNGYHLMAPEPEVVLVMQALAAGEISDDQLAQWLKRYSG